MKRLILGLTLVFVSHAALAAQRNIYFGGANGSPSFGYEPVSMNVEVGDTIVWHGDFSMHPLISFVTPDGVASFASSTGDVFAYVVTQAGTYRYRCEAHSTPDGQGMAGFFTAGSAGVREDPYSSVSLSPAYPNPVSAMKSTTIHIVLEHPSPVRLDLINAKGERVQTILDANEATGMHMITLNVESLPSGTYSYILSTPDAVLRRGLVIAK